MKKILFYLLLGLVSCSIKASAQQLTYLLPLDDNLLLNKQQSKISKERALEVIDLTGDSVLGYLPTEKESNDRIAILAPLPKQEWLQSIVSGSLNSLLTGRQLLYIVNDISVGRHSNGNYSRVKATVYESTVGANAYKLLKEVSDITTDNSSSMNTVSSLIGNVLGNTFSLLGGVIGGVAGKTMTREEVIAFEKSKYAFISDNSFTSGIYMSYGEFKNRKPSFEQFYLAVDTATGNIQVNSLSGYSDTSPKPVNPWAIAAANELYIFKNGKLYATEAIGNNLVISKYINPQRRVNNAKFWRDNLGKQFILWEDSNPFDNRYTIRLSNYQKKNIIGEAIKVNADTGEFEL